MVCVPWRRQQEHAPLRPRARWDDDGLGLSSARPVAPHLVKAAAHQPLDAVVGRRDGREDQDLDAVLGLQATRVGDAGRDRMRSHGQRSNGSTPSRAECAVTVRRPFHSGRDAAVLLIRRLRGEHEQAARARARRVFGGRDAQGGSVVGHSEIGIGHVEARPDAVVGDDAQPPLARAWQQCTVQHQRCLCDSTRDRQPAVAAIPTELNGIGEVIAIGIDAHPTGLKRPADDLAAVGRHHSHQWGVGGDGPRVQHGLALLQDDAGHALLQRQDLAEPISGGNVCLAVLTIGHADRRGKVPCVQQPAAAVAQLEAEGTASGEMGAIDRARSQLRQPDMPRFQRRV